MRCGTGLYVEIIAANPGGRGKGRDGEIYNIGGNRSLPNLEVGAEFLVAPPGSRRALIEYVTDPGGHDRRYALSSEKLNEGNRVAAGKWISRRGLKTDPRVVPANSHVVEAGAERRVSGSYYEKNMAAGQWRAERA